MEAVAVVKPPLSQGVAYGIVLGFGIVFALSMNTITWISRKYLHESADTNMQLTARKNVKSGLVASAVVSSWCYATTILNSVRLTYVFGFLGLWWFVSGATVKIILISSSSCMESRSRFSLLQHFFWAAMNYLIPLGVVVYTYLGGLKATFLSDYIHTMIIFVILLITMFAVMSPAASPAATAHPAYGTKGGEYLTMESDQSLLLAGVILVSGLGSVFVDASYGQKAIAGEPFAVVRGYFYGGFAWFSIPLDLCATMSFVAVGLQDSEYWLIPGRITAYQINNALILPLAAQAVMGTGGPVAVILMVFMAVTSSFSAKIIAHASIVTFDIYQPYINPTASDKKLKMVSHGALTGFAIFSASFATALNASGISMGWILEFLGVVLGAAVIPIALAITNAHVSSLYMIIAAPVGTICGLAARLGTTKGMYGEINVATTFENWSMFAGYTVSLCLPLLIWACMWPFMRTPYDWDMLFLMQALQPRAGDAVYAYGEDVDLGADWDPQGLRQASNWAKIVSAVLCLVI
ncbi:uncharacterized protein BDZ99DRAFT_539943 [Mytilinidion resinicola]|uniref:Uncharacterized protein n=1 Tax=Mytilinidion resinicola TaxID=574789 RepID=A0A6A6Y9Y0_9PEZI|nr:uncharacterized protein BDZ99DRAFT_539943 [Mytilinidion resinicola]KAF2805510.1 hypothetical protein BDZ99DRAFT_539943 [Mytilinidion resinicola]